MSQVQTVVTFDAEKGTVKFSLDLQGNSELEHELLAAAIGTGRSVSMTPAHAADELFAEFTIADPSIWPTAVHNLENRHRIADGRPTLEEEAAKVEAAKKAQAEAEAAAAAAAKEPTPEEKMQKAIADGIASGLKQAGVAPKS